MIKFLKSISFFSVSMDRLIQENKNTKKMIQNAIEKRLQNGTIKPFDHCVLTGADVGTQALK